MLGLQGLVACAAAGVLLSFAGARAPILSAPPPGVSEVRTLHVADGDQGAAMLVEAMSASQPDMGEAESARFATVLAAAGDAVQLDDAWRVFAGGFFDKPEKQAHRRTLELLVFAAVTDKHAPAVAKEAREAARFKQRRDRLTQYIEAVQRALKAAEASGKAVAIEFSLLDAKAGPHSKPMSAQELRERLVTATRNRDAMNRSFNLQYLALQQQMQTDNRQYADVAVIMKTKHKVR
jgi:hypothetical protein